MMKFLPALGALVFATPAVAANCGWYGRDGSFAVFETIDQLSIRRAGAPAERCIIGETPISGIYSASCGSGTKFEFFMVASTIEGTEGNIMVIDPQQVLYYRCSGPSVG